MKEIDLKQIITQHPECIEDSDKLKIILLDIYPNISKGIINVLCVITYCGIAKEINECETCNKIQIDHWLYKLANEYYLTGEIVSNCLNLWCNAIFSIKEKVLEENYFKEAKEYINKGNAALDSERIVYFVKAIECFEKIKYSSFIYKERIKSVLMKIYMSCKLSTNILQQIYFMGIEKCSIYNYKDSILLLGRCYKYGIGTKLDISKAINCYRKIQNNSSEALIELGDCLQYGFGVKENLDFAVYEYQKAINLGNEKAKDLIDDIIALKENCKLDKYSLSNTWKTVNGFVVQNNILKRYIGSDSVIIVPNYITEIEPWAFAECKTLKNVIMGNHIEKVGMAAFYNCKALQSVSIESTKITIIPKKVFLGCENLQRVILPNNIESIESFAFSYCKRLKEIAIPDGTKSIFEKAFLGCEKLEQISLPYSLKEICNGTFFLCSNLISIEYRGNITLWNNIKGARLLEEGKDSCFFNFVNLISDNYICNLKIKNELPIQIQKETELYNIPIEQLGLKIQTYAALKRANFHTVNDIIRMDQNQLLQIRGVGESKLNEIIEKLNKINLHLRKD